MKLDSNWDRYLWFSHFVNLNAKGRNIVSNIIPIRTHINAGMNTSNSRKDI